MQFYEVLIRYIDGRESVRFDSNRRDEMLELVNTALERWDVAYIHVAKRDEEGNLLNQKLIEGIAYNDFIDNI